MQMTRKKNFLDKDAQKKALVAGGIALVGVPLILAYRSWYRDKNPQLKSPYRPGDRIQVMQGVPFDVIVPRGRYVVPSNDVITAVQTDVGADTYVSLVTEPIVDDPYVIETLLINEADNSKQFKIKIQAYPTEDFVRNGDRKRSLRHSQPTAHGVPTFYTMLE